MSDVFISYRRDDRARAKALCDSLKLEGLDVWWDEALAAGDTFDQKIQDQLRSARAVIVCWSKAAVASDWVRAEATIGRDRNVLIPVLVEDAAIPVPFNLIQTPDLTAWNGDRSDPVYRALVDQVKTVADRKDVKPIRRAPSRAARRARAAAFASVAALAVAGASLWAFKPWEQMKAITDPVGAAAERAKAKADAQIQGLAKYGVLPEDIRLLDWRTLVRRRFKPETLADLQKAAEGNDAAAQALLCAVDYWGAPPAPSDEASAAHWCRTGAEAGNPAAQVFQGYLLRAREDDAGSVEWFKKAAAQNWPWGQLELGVRYENGLGIDADLTEAVSLYKAAAAAKLPQANYALANLNLTGVGMPRNRPEGVRLLREAASAGDPLAMYRLGEILRDGLGEIAKSPDEARAFLSQAASQTDEESIQERAKNDLAEMDKAASASGAPSAP